MRTGNQCRTQTQCYPDHECIITENDMISSLLKIDKLTSQLACCLQFDMLLSTEVFPFEMFNRLACSPHFDMFPAFNMLPAVFHSICYEANPASALSLSRLRFTFSKLQSCQSVPHRSKIDCGTFMLQGVANTPIS